MRVSMTDEDCLIWRLLTNCDWLDADTFLEMCAGSVIGFFGMQNLLAA
jgi:hypothetical protein